MNKTKTLFFSLIISLVAAGIVLAFSGPSANPPSSDALPPVRLQSSTPGTQQTGHLNISGTGLFAGNVGIGTTVPGAQLEVGTNVAFTGKRIRSLGYSTTGSSDANLEIGDGGTVYWRFLRNSSNAFEMNLSNTLGIMGGNVGIGTVNPGQKLEVNGNIKLSAANPYIYSGSSYIVIPNGLYVSGGTPYFQNQIQARGGLHNDDTTYLTIAGGTGGITYFSGDVGIGTAVPGAKLEVAGTVRATAYRTAGGAQLSVTVNYSDCVYTGCSGLNYVECPTNYVAIGRQCALACEGNCGTGLRCCRLRVE